jgi:hypothetical protein
MVEFFARSGVKLNVLYEDSKGNASSVASVEYSLDIVQFLAESEIVVNASGDMTTPNVLKVATGRGHDGSVQYLIGHEAVER